MTEAGRARLDELRCLDPDPNKPWGGRSPRVLTRSYKMFKLGLRGPALNASDASEKVPEDPYA